MALFYIGIVMGAKLRDHRRVILSDHHGPFLWADGRPARPGARPGHDDHDMSDGGLSVGDAVSARLLRGVRMVRIYLKDQNKTLYWSYEN